jgi:copper oxidase (laccase) domain-containing protein
MNSDFSLVVHDHITLLVFTPWWEQGLIHGMTTRELQCRGTAFDESVKRLCAALPATDLALAQQCHGTGVLDLRSADTRTAIKSQFGDMLRRSEADAVVAPRHNERPNSMVAYGVMSADCVPIVVRGDDGYALIHAGWRGLANGIIGNALAAVRTPKEAVVFACAGGDSYEVGSEVLSAIGDSAVYRQAPGDTSRYLLDTAATAIAQLRRGCAGIEAHAAGVCTISDQRFHSFRRDGEGAGRCITFVLPPRSGPLAS